MAETSSQPNRSARIVPRLLPALLPGAGQLAAGRLFRGLACGVLVSACLGLVLADRYVVEPFLEPANARTLLLLAASAYVGSWVDTVVLVVRGRSARLAQSRVGLLRSGNHEVICGRLEAALEHYRQVLAVDRFDIGTWLKIARVELLLGRTKQARAHLAVCRHLDEHARWRYRIDAATAMAEDQRPRGR